MMIEATYGIDIRVWVLGLAMLSQDTRGDLIHLADEFEHGVVREVAESKLALRNITRIGLAQDSMTVSWDDLTRFEGGP